MRMALLAAAGVLILAGCGEESGSDPDVQAGPDLDGRTFVATSIIDAGRLRHLAAGTELRLSFDDGRLGIEAGCNHMSGRYRIESGRLTVRSMSTTEMGCEPRLMAQDVWVSGLFADPVTFDLAGDLLRLHSGDVELELTDREVASPDVALVGTTWHLTSLITGDTVSSIPTGFEATLLIDDDGLHVDTTCSEMDVAATVEGSTITIGDSGRGSSSTACADGLQTVDKAIQEALSRDVTWEVEETSLTLTREGVGLGFSAD